MKRITIIAALTLPILLGGCLETKHGEKVGSIVKISEETSMGLCPSMESEIIRGGLNNGSGVMGQSFHFTIENRPDLLAKLQTALDTNAEVKIKYKTEAATWCRSVSNNFVTDVEFVGKEGARPLQVAPIQATVTEAPKTKTPTKEELVAKLLENNNEIIKQLLKTK